MLYLWQNTFGYVTSCPISSGEDEQAKWKMWKYFIKPCIKTVRNQIDYAAKDDMNKNVTQKIKKGV